MFLRAKNGLQMMLRLVDIRQHVNTRLIADATSLVSLVDKSGVLIEKSAFATSFGRILGSSTLGATRRPKGKAHKEVFTIGKPTRKGT